MVAPEAPDPDKLAETCIQTMWSNDRASPGIGMKLENVGSGRSQVSLSITESMLNGVGTCHGGFIFALADSAFAFACNSYNQFAVAQHCSITYLRPAHIGDTLTAHASETERIGRTGLYDVRVVDQAGSCIAEFRGQSRLVRGEHVPNLTEAG